MKIFLFKSVLFLLINLALAGIILVYNQNRYVYYQWNSEAHLYSIPHGYSYDTIIMGASHGRVLSSCGNHLRLEKILGKQILNFSKTSAGLVPEKAYLSYFYNQGNSAKIILYIIDPFIFYSDRWNEKNYFLEYEPLKFNFLTVALHEQLSKEVFFNYIRSKFSYFWFTGQKPLLIQSRDSFLTAVDNDAVKKRLEVLYPNGVDSVNFDHYKKIIEDTVMLANKNGSKVIFIFPSTLLGNLPGKLPVVNELKSLQNRSNMEVYDFSEAVTNPHYFSDHDHLNTIGVELFTAKYLKPIVDKN